MNKTIFAVEFTGALTGTAQNCGWKNFDAPAELIAEVQNKPVLQSVAEQTNHAHRGVLARASVTRDNLGDIHGPPLNPAAFPERVIDG